MSHIGLLSFQPRRFGRLVCVSAALHDSSHVFTKLSLDIAQSPGAAAILHGIMQQRGDRFHFVSAVFHRDRTDAEDMRDVRNPRLFSELSAVNARGVSQRFFELTREPHISLSLVRSKMTVSATATLARC